MRLELTRCWDDFPHGICLGYIETSEDPQLASDHVLEQWEDFKESEADSDDEFLAWLNEHPSKHILCVTDDYPVNEIILE